MIAWRLPWQTSAIALLLNWLIITGACWGWYDLTTSYVWQTLTVMLLSVELLLKAARSQSQLSRLTQAEHRKPDNQKDNQKRVEQNERYHRSQNSQNRSSAIGSADGVADQIAELQATADRLQHYLQEQRQSGQALQDSEAQFRMLIQVLEVGVLLQDAEARILLCNPSAQKLLGLSEAQMLGKSSFDLDWQVVHEDGSAFAAKTLPVPLAIATRQPVHNVVMGVYRKQTEPSPDLVWLLVSAEPQLTADGRVRHVVCSLSDITQRKQLLELQMRQAQRQKAMNQVVQTIRNSLDLETVFVTATAAIAHLLRADRAAIGCYLAEEQLWRNVADYHLVELPSVLGKTVDDRHHLVSAQLKQFQVVQIDGISPVPSQIDLSLTPELAQACAAGWLVVPLQINGGLWGSLDLTRTCGRAPWQDTEVEMAMAIADQLAIAIQQSELYQQLQTANQELLRLATLDGLTQIPNRRRFDDYLAQEWLRMARHPTPLSLILCDVDFFKPYNDTYGHLAGDACLVRVSKAIAQAIKRPADLAARYGGEEFAIVLPDTGVAGAVKVAQAIQAEVRRLQLPHIASSVSAHVTLSLGIASVQPGARHPIQTLIDSADQALYQAKAAGRDRFHVNRLTLSPRVDPSAPFDSLPSAEFTPARSGQSLFQTTAL